tara:strand:+ start:1112 stop:1873 length:762 start_codon:yes stop_codon:yes gene_type:complete
MSKAYGKKIYDALKENKVKSLSVLLEQDEEETDEEETKDTDSSAPADAGVEAGSDAEISDELDDATLKQSIEQAEKILKNVADNQDEPFTSIESAADAAIKNAAINASVNENSSIIKKYYKTKSIGPFINEADDQKIKKMTDTMSGLEDQLKKYQDTVDSITKGVDIHMPTFVREALASLLSFDSKFSKQDIVFKIFRNKLASSSGKNAKENIEEFDRLFYEELHKIDNSISKEDVIIPADKSHVAAGAMKQG